MTAAEMLVEAAAARRIADKVMTWSGRAARRGQQWRARAYLDESHMWHVKACDLECRAAVAARG